MTRDIKQALKSGKYRYALRIDIKGYYASINHQKLLELLQKNFDDPLILGYLNDIVKRLVDRDGVLFSPERGIPLRSTLSPFFGALYLTPLDEAFSSGDVFYRRYVDDVIILVKNERQLYSQQLAFRRGAQLSSTRSVVLYMTGARWAQATKPKGQMRRVYRRARKRLL